MIEFLREIAAIGGVGAVFAVLMFLVYKQTVRQMREDRKYMEDRMSDLTTDYNNTTKGNTAALTELITWLKTKNGSH